MQRAILHIDMDAFFASVEQRDQPALRGLPVIVGGHPKRGVVLAASYEVRPFGVRSAIPMARALQLAPDAVVVPPRFEAYAQASEQVFGIFESYTPLVEGLSLDEAFLDVTASVSLFGPPAQIARSIRKRIRDELGLPASAGIAPVKLVAKIASDSAKPDGQREVCAEEVLAFLAALPVRRLWGVGPKTEAVLHRLGLHLVGDIAAADPARLARALGPLGRELWDSSHGLDGREVVPDRAAKSVGAEDTFGEDTADPELLRRHVHAQALRVARRLRRAGVRGRVVQLKVKMGDFRLVTRRITLSSPTDDGQAIFRAAANLLGDLRPSGPVRLTGVSVQDLSAGQGQLDLFGESSERARRLNQALDLISTRFGPGALRTADLLMTESESLRDEQDRTATGASRLDRRPEGAGGTRS